MMKRIISLVLCFLVLFAVGALQDCSLARPHIVEAREEGWSKHASGLLYKVLTSGPKAGPRPSVTDRCTVHYRGRIAGDDSGYVFDSSYKRGSPSTFAPDSVILGWKIALTMMRPGDKWQVRK